LRDKSRAGLVINSGVQIASAAVLIALPMQLRLNGLAGMAFFGGFLVG
jgi:hypothetical protein